jgi:4-hydroxybenzoate polyprenyltransferase
MRKILLLLLYLELSNCFAPFMCLNSNLPKNINFKTNINSYLTLSRAKNIPFEFMLPITGSYIATHNVNVFYNPEILLLGLLSVLIGSNSMIINDYFDYIRGVDKYKDWKVLNKGLLKSEEVLRVSYLLNVINIILISLINNTNARIILSSSILFSYIYTPLIKPILLLKNIGVALTITQTIIIGGIIVDKSIINILKPVIYIFNIIMWQEIILDILDKKSDKEENIKTIPVVYGTNISKKIAFIFLLIATLVPYGISSPIFILLQSPLLYSNLRSIIFKNKINKKIINVGSIVVLLSGINMCIL